MHNYIAARINNHNKITNWKEEENGEEEDEDID